MSHKLPVRYIEALNAFLAASQSPKDRFGYVELVGTRCFYKRVSASDIEREISGYDAIRAYYPVPLLIGFLQDGKDSYVLLYEYEESIGENEGLLLDIFSVPSHDEHSFEPVLEMYSNAFQKTLSKNTGKAADIFFRNRISSRLHTFYNNSFFKQCENFTLNGSFVSIASRSVIEDITHFFTTRKDEWCVISQCDPNDLNIGVRPVLFDFTAGGHVPIWGEFATLFWYQLAQGGYLSPKYNKHAFEHHDAIMRNLDVVTHTGSLITHHPSALRKIFVRRYIERVLDPLWERIGEEGWYEKFKNYIAMKILCVFDLNTMNQTDRLLSIGYLDRIYYGSEPKHPSSLLSLFADESM